MAFVNHPGDEALFESVEFRRSPFVIVAPPDHPLAQKSSVTLRETLCSLKLFKMLHKLH